MKKLYCDSCGNYLMGGDGECHDCPCGWTQPPDNPEEVIQPMDEDQMLSLREFLGQHWALWEDHCEQRGEDPNEIYVVVLGGEE